MGLELLPCGHEGTAGLPCLMCDTIQRGSESSGALGACGCAACAERAGNPSVCGCAACTGGLGGFEQMQPQSEEAQRANGRRQAEARLRELPGRDLLHGDNALAIIRRRYVSR